MQNYTDSYSVSITVFSIDMQAASLVHPLHQSQGVSFTSSKICFVTLPCLRSSPALCSSLSFSLQPGKYMIWFIACILSVQLSVFRLFFCFLRFWFWFLILGTHLSLTSANIFQYLASGIHSAWRALLKCKRWSGETLGVKIYNSSPSLLRYTTHPHRMACRPSQTNNCNFLLKLFFRHTSLPRLRII